MELKKMQILDTLIDLEVVKIGKHSEGLFEKIIVLNKSAKNFMFYNN